MIETDPTANFGTAQNVGSKSSDDGSCGRDSRSNMELGSPSVQARARGVE